MQLRRSSVIGWLGLIAATLTVYAGPIRGLSGRSDALGDATRPFVLASPIFSPKTGTSFTTLFTSYEDTSMSMLLRRYDAVGTLLTSQAIAIGAHGSLQASPAAHSGAPLHVEIWAPKPHVEMLITYTDSGDVARRIEWGDMHEPDRLSGAFTPMTPFRLCNTNDGGGTACQGQTLGLNGNLNVTAAGVGGIPSLAKAVMFSAQGDGTAASYLTFWPAGESRPQISQVTFGPGSPVTTTVTVKLGAGGAFSIFNKFGNTDVILDVAGYFL